LTGCFSRNSASQEVGDSLLKATTSLRGRLTSRTGGTLSDEKPACHCSLPITMPEYAKRLRGSTVVWL
jgi:hypothetical protein